MNLMLGINWLIPVHSVVKVDSLYYDLKLEYG